MKVCGIFNIAPLYRKAIYSLMDKQLGIDFLFGEHSAEGIATMRGEGLEGFRGYLSNIYHGSKLIWQRKALRLALLTRRYDCYVLTGNAGILSNWIIALVARCLGRKVVLWSHGLRGEEQGMTLRKNLWYFRLSSHIMLYGNRAKRLLIDHGIDEKKMTVVYNSLDFDTQMGLMDKLGDKGFARNYFGNSLPYVCYVGRLTVGKELDLLLRAMVNPECNLIVLGDGPAREQLEALCTELEIQDKVWFQGESYDQQHIGTVLLNAAACVSPGSMGLTAIHSLTFGTPIITHNNLQSQFPETEVLVEGVTGLHFKQGDEKDLSRAICNYINLSDLQRAVVRKNCRDEIENRYNPHVQIQIMQNMFDKL